MWAWNAKGPRNWVRLITGMTGQAAVDELVVRKDRVRRSGQPTKFALRDDGDPPPPLPGRD